MGVRIYPYIEKDKIYGLDLGVYVITINKNYKIKLIVR